MEIYCIYSGFDQFNIRRNGVSNGNLFQKRSQRYQLFIQAHVLKWFCFNGGQISECNEDGV